MDGRGVVWVYVEVELKILRRWQKIENESWGDERFDRILCWHHKVLSSFGFQDFLKFNYKFQRFNSI